MSKETVERLLESIKAELAKQAMPERARDGVRAAIGGVRADLAALQVHAGPLPHG